MPAVPPRSGHGETPGSPAGSVCPARTPELAAGGDRRRRRERTGRPAAPWSRAGRPRRAAGGTGAPPSAPRLAGPCCRAAPPVTSSRRRHNCVTGPPPVGTERAGKGRHCQTPAPPPLTAADSSRDLPTKDSEVTYGSSCFLTPDVTQLKVPANKLGLLRSAT